MLQKATLVSAVRLPHSLFKEAGTEAGTDFIIVQKRAKPTLSFSEAEESFTQTTTFESEKGIIKSNRYYDLDPTKIIHTRKEISTNQYGKPAFIYSHAGESTIIGEELGKVFQKDLEVRFNRTLYASGSTTARQRKTYPAGQLDLFSQMGAMESVKSEPIRYTGPVYNHLMNGSVMHQASVLGQLIRDETGQAVLEPIKLSERQQRLWKSLVEVRDAYFQLVHQERDNQKEDPGLRGQLNQQYDTFRDKFGGIKDLANLDTVLLDPAGRQLLSLEVYNESARRYEKSDIFRAPVHLAKARVQVFSPEESLASSLNRFGKVDLNFMAELAGQRAEELVRHLENEIFFHPVEAGYQTGMFWVREIFKRKWIGFVTSI